MITLKISSLIIAVMTASLFAAAPLTVYAQTIPLPLLQINPVNAAAAANSDDDTVVQVNSAEVEQKSDVDCEAKVSDDDEVAQVGDNANTAANDCDTTQTATVAQAIVNQDNDVQVAEATACQVVALGAGVNICDNVITVSPPPPTEESVYCLEAFADDDQPVPVTFCFEDEADCEATEDNLDPTLVTEECAEFPEPPPGSFLCTFDEQGSMTCSPVDE